MIWCDVEFLSFLFVFHFFILSSLISSLLFLYHPVHLLLILSISIFIHSPLNMLFLNWFATGTWRQSLVCGLGRRRGTRWGRENCVRGFWLSCSFYPAEWTPRGEVKPHEPHSWSRSSSIWCDVVKHDVIIRFDLIWFYSMEIVWCGETDAVNDSASQQVLAEYGMACRGIAWHVYGIVQYGIVW